jgi:integrase
MAVEALKRHRDRQEWERRQAGDAWDEADRVFCNGLGRPLEAGNVKRRSFWALLDRAKLPRIRFHDLRHSMASLLLADCVHPKVVQELLGHSQISLTMDTYSHVMPGVKRDAVRRLGALLGSRE